MKMPEATKKKKSSNGMWDTDEIVTEEQKKQAEDFVSMNFDSEDSDDSDLEEETADDTSEDE